MGYHQLSITDPNRRILNGKESSVTGPNREKCTCISYEKSTTSATQPVRGHLHLNSCFSPADFPLTPPLPTSSSFIKQYFSPLFVGLAHGFCSSLFVPDFNFPLFPNKHIFASKITVLLLRSINPNQTLSDANHRMKESVYHKGIWISSIVHSG